MSQEEAGQRAPVGRKQTLAQIEGALAACFLFLIAALVIVQVASRSLDYSAPWTDEVIRFLLIWLVYLGAAYSFATGSPIRVELFITKLSIKQNAWIDMFASIITFATCAFMVVNSAPILELQRGALSTAAEIPMVVVYSAAIVGLFLIGTHAVVHVARQVQLIRGSGVQA